MPRAPKKCGNPDCETRIPGGRVYCDACDIPWQGSTWGGSTREWRKLRAQVLEEEPLCRDCGAPATEAGHIVPRSAGGADVRSNLKGQCSPCNVAQIRADQRRI